MPITPAQSRAARGLLDWSQTDLGARSNLSESTIRDFEKGRRVPSANNLAAVERALEVAGVIFVEENGDGPGVRLKKGGVTQAQPHGAPALPTDRKHGPERDVDQLGSDELEDDAETKPSPKKALKEMKAAIAKDEGTKKR